MTQEEIRDIFEQCGVVRKGHFLLASGRHSGLYFEKFQILQYPDQMARLCFELAKRFVDMSVDVVAGPTTGGMLIAYEVARHLGTRCIFAERTEAGRGFLRSLKINPGEKVLIVDDVMTTGGSLRDTVKAVREAGGEIVGIGVFVDRSEKPTDFGLAIESLWKEEVETHLAENCPHCREGKPLTKPGGR